jgi:exodeoxyribonuclease III
MKIATFNINNVVCRLPNLQEWLRAAERDVVCLQEFKAADASFPTAALEDAGYGAVWRGQRSWKGVAILARGRQPILVRDELPGDSDDTQSRRSTAVRPLGRAPRARESAADLKPVAC